MNGVARGNAETTTRLVINADDFAYYDCVSRGILETIETGAVTATGILATSTRFSTWAARLADEQRADCGVHLDLTWGCPQSKAMRDALGGDDQFPGQGKMVGAVLRGRIAPATIKMEWRAQLERALAAGLTVRFLNSHQHIHLLPSLSEIMCELAQEFRIPFIRQLSPEWQFSRGAAAKTRSLVVGLLPKPDYAGMPVHSIPCLGLGASGRLNLDYLRRRLAALQPGGVYELMCHPGHDDARETIAPALRRYHAWEQELSTLCSAECGQLFRELGIDLVRFRDLAE